MIPNYELSKKLALMCMQSNRVLLTLAFRWSILNTERYGSLPCWVPGFQLRDPFIRPIVDDVPFEVWYTKGVLAPILVAGKPENKLRNIH